jgi:NAD-dependent DNA ligase
MIFEKPVQRDIAGTVCITGKLKSFKTKAEAAKALEQHGYTVKSSVTKDVTVLVNESGIESQKTIKARNDGLTIVENLLEFLGENYGTA